MKRSLASYETNFQVFGIFENYMLKKRGIRLSGKTVLNYYHKGIIPREYVKVEIWGFRRKYKFVPEVVDFLEDIILNKQGKRKIS